MTALAGIFGFIPGWIWAAMFAGAVATSCIQGDRLDREKLAHSETKTTFAEERAAAARTALILSEKNRQTEQELQDAKTENEQQAAALLEAIHRADLVAALASRQLQDAARDAADAARARCASAGAPGGGQTGTDIIGLFAELLGEVDAAAATYAAEADRSRIRGLACESAYDSARQALNQSPTN